MHKARKGKSSWGNVFCNTGIAPSNSNPEMALDGKPYTTIAYGNGPGFQGSNNYSESCQVRKNLTETDTGEAKTQIMKVIKCKLWINRAENTRTFLALYLQICWTSKDYFIRFFEKVSAVNFYTTVCHFIKRCLKQWKKRQIFIFRACDNFFRCYPADTRRQNSRSIFLNDSRKIRSNVANN